MNTPEEYDLRLRFTKQSGESGIAAILSRGDRSFTWHAGANTNTAFGFGFPGGGNQLLASNSTITTVDSCLEVGRLYTAEIAVRNSGVTAYLDGKMISELPADLGDMKTSAHYTLRTPGALGIASYQSAIHFHSVELREITGKARLLRTAPALTSANPGSVTPATASAPTDPVSAKLAELEKTFLAAYEAQVAPKHTAAVATLNGNYVAALDRAIGTASQAGKLDEALALRDEKTQIETHGRVPAEDAVDLPRVLAPLRTTYRTAYATLLTNRDQLAAPLHAAYDRALATYQDELTRAQKLDDATRVKAVRDHVASRRESNPEPTMVENPTAASPPPVGQASTTLPPTPIAPPLTADQILPPLPKPSPEDIAALVNWILNDRKGSVTLAEGPSRREFKQGAPLPPGNLKVVGIYIYEFPNDEPSRKFLELLGGLPDLESLYIARHSGVFPIVSLRGLTKLKTLTLNLGKFDDSGFAHLSGLTGLTQVTFASISGFTGTGLGYLSEGINELQLSGCPHLSVEGLAYVSRFRKLHSLDIYDSKGFTDEALRPLAGLPELETLVVRNTPIDGSFLSFLPGNSKLKLLGLSETAKFQPQHLIEVGKLKQLETLSLPPLDPPAEAMASLAALGNLKEIGFHAPFTGETLAGIKGFRSLIDLDLDETPITDTGWAAIAGSMPNLGKLDYKRFADSKGPVSATAMGEHLGKLRSLESVAAMHNGITDEWMPAIAKLKSVRSLSLQGAGITDAGLALLQDMEITHLIIRQTGITDAAVPTLKRFPALRSGEFHQTQITDPVRAEFGEFLKARAD